jgi:cellobiose phosphorylase
MNVVGWQYILGIRPTLQGLKIAPCIPHEWESFQVQRRWRGTEYEITVSNPEHLCSGKVQLVVDGKPFPGDLLPPARKKRVKVEATITEE